MVVQERESREPVVLPEKVVTAVLTAVQNLTVEACPQLRGDPAKGGLEDDHAVGSGVAQVGWPSLTDPTKDRDQGGEGAIQELSKALAAHDSQLDLLAAGEGAQPSAGAADGPADALPVDAADEGGQTANEGAHLGSTAALLLAGGIEAGVMPQNVAGACVKVDKAAGGGGLSLATPGGSTNLARWRRLHREEQEERVVVQAACTTHVQFGVPTPPNSGSDLSSGKVVFLDKKPISSAGNKRRMPDGQDLVVSFKSTSSESVESKGVNVVPPACKKVCGERVETQVGIDGNMVHVTKEVDGGEEVAQGRRRESVGEGKDDEGSVKDATDPGAVGQLTGACDENDQLEL
uniref:Uncharacterized protein n=1 Tax=Triticum aestivum TaxID=4565 RepID=A0A3B6AUQ4_WHEAT